MSLDRETLALLIDLVDNKLTSMEVFDRDDRREMARLEHTLQQLQAMDTSAPTIHDATRARSRSSVTLHAF